jgi:hypothetical protein
MILYNTTFTFHSPLCEQLSVWLRDQWLPEARYAGLTDSTVARLLVELDPEATAFAVQGRFIDERSAILWRDGRGAELLADLSAKYGERILPFTTFMEVIDL